MRAHAALLRWLGPWTPGDRIPPRVERQSVVVPARGGRPDFEAWLYTPGTRRPDGAMLIAPGLHYAGPADPRLDRFCRVLAASGTTVLAPFLPDYTALRVEETVIADLATIFDLLEARRERPAGVRPGVFSVSFGSLPALRLAADPERAERVGGLVVFGGYADFGVAIRFCLGVGTENRRRDPLNQPVVLLNLLDALGEVPERAALEDGWRRYVRATWGRPEMKADAAWRAVAARIEAELPAEARPLFRLGTGQDAGAAARVAEALDRTTAARPWLDPRPRLGGLRCPVTLVHGLDDDVIPASELEALAAALPARVAVRRYLTGLYDHTRAAAGPGAVLAAGREVRSLLGMLDALVTAARTR